MCLFGQMSFFEYDYFPYLCEIVKKTKEEQIILPILLHIYQVCPGRSRKSSDLINVKEVKNQTSH